MVEACHAVDTCTAIIGNPPVKSYAESVGVHRTSNAGVEASRAVPTRQLRRRPFGATDCDMRKAKLREETIRVRFTSDELATARARARAEGVPVSTYLRRLAVTTRPAPAESEERVKRALAALSSLSTKEADELRRNVHEVREGWTRGRR